MSKSDNKGQKSMLMNLVAGGGAGATESMICHPLDTIKTRLQLQRSVGVRTICCFNFCHVISLISSKCQSLYYTSLRAMWGTLYENVGYSVEWIRTSLSQCLSGISIRSCR